MGQDDLPGQYQQRPSMNTSDYFDIPPLPANNSNGGGGGRSGGAVYGGRGHNAGYPPSIYSNDGGGSGGYGYREPRANRPQVPQQVHRRPAPAPIDSRGSNLREMFQSYDRNNSGTLSEGELAAGLYNDDGTRFSRDTTRLMFRMFDLDRNGRINYDEFVELWRYLCEWKGIFDRMDVDQSKRVTYNEFHRAVESFGYNLSAKVIQSLFSVYANSRDARNQPALTFDMFVQAFVRLRNITDSFKKFDTDRDGYVTMGFEQYLLEVTYLQ